MRCLLLFQLWLISAFAIASAQPNIVFILADDLGITDINAYAERFSGKSADELFYETPNLDRLVGQGLVFSQAYANQLCTPTRAAIMTGRYPSRMGITTATPPNTHTYYNQGVAVSEGANPHDAYAHADPINLSQAWINGYTNTALDPSIPSLPQVLRGYDSHFAGKWHLGGHGAKGFQPQDHGFKVINYYDVGGSTYFNWQEHWKPKANKFPKMPQEEVVLGDPGEPPYEDYLIDDTAARVESFLMDYAASDKARPFFLYVNHFAVHTPLQAPEESIAHFEKKLQRGVLGHDHATYAAMVKHLDDALGRVIAALEDTGLAENTIVIFTSDNGGVEYTDPPATDNAPFRGGKACLYEGGVRVPLVVYWKGHYEGGLWVNQPVNCVDFLPTLAELTENKVPPSALIDGESFVELLNDPESGPKERTFIWHYPYNVVVKHPNDGLPLTPHSAIRKGDYKLLWDWHGRLELYDVEHDPFETQDLSDMQPERTQALFDELRGWLELNVEKRYWPQVNPNYDPDLDGLRGPMRDFSMK